MKIKLKAGKKYSICSCGLSGSLPFCDNTHREFNSAKGTEYKSVKIIDDILDVDIEGSNLGKPLGQDLKQGILTLPILLYLDSNREEEDGIRKLKTLSLEEKESNIENILSKVRNYGSIERAYEIARTYAQKGIEAIETSPKSPARDSLQEIAQFVIERKI